MKVYFKSENELTIEAENITENLALKHWRHLGAEDWLARRNRIKLLNPKPNSELANTDNTIKETS